MLGRIRFAPGKLKEKVSPLFTALGNPAKSAEFPRFHRACGGCHPRHIFQNTPHWVGWLFAAAGFNGFMSAEFDKKYEGGENATTGMPKLIAEIRVPCRKYFNRVSDVGEIYPARNTGR